MAARPARRFVPASGASAAAQGGAGLAQPIQVPA
jgi:hypothetical protein